MMTVELSKQKKQKWLGGLTQAPKCVRLASQCVDDVLKAMLQEKHEDGLENVVAGVVSRMASMLRDMLG